MTQPLSDRYFRLLDTSRDVEIDRGIKKYVDRCDDR